MRTNSGLVGAGGMALGGALMYLLDPDRGARRRHVIRDRAARAGRVTGEGLETAARDMRNRARGLAASARGRLRGRDADDSVLEARVRTELGRAVSHPGAIDVYVEDGRVILTGAVLESELEQLLDRVRKVPGVSEVDNQLRVHATAEGVPALQGGHPRWPARFELQQENWAPAVRALTAGAGTAVLIWALRRRDFAAGLVGVGALSLLARGATNIPLRRLTGVGAGRRAVDVQKSITINAPPARVFAFLTEWEEWPRWMSHVREVRAEGTRGEQERTHWVVDGPLGVPVVWDAVTTRLVPNEEIAWKTVPGAAVQHAGTIRLVSVDDRTRVEVHMSYNPPGGAVGHAVAASVGRDPKRQMDADLARLKTTIETGQPPHDARD
jgi:uncharacterized membrane protein